MLTDPGLRSKVDALWDKLWSGGLSNPADVIEQLSYLIFFKRLDEKEEDGKRTAARKGTKYKPIFPNKELRWGYWTQLPAEKALKHVKEEVFPFIKGLGGEGGAFGEHMANAEFKISKPSLLIEACRSLEEMQLSAQNQDVQGDIFEYILNHLSVAGKNGQFRTPRHIIRMMVKIIDPRPGERICDPAAGTCGFLVNAYQHILETHTQKDVLKYDDEGWPHFLIGDKLSKEEHKFLQSKAFTGYDSDSGMTMLRIGCMNLILHGIDQPNFRWKDSLSKAFSEERCYDVVLANPPFKGAIDELDVNPTLPTKVKKTEILFLHLFIRLLENGGRGAVIVPEGVLFGSSKAHVEIRRRLVEENRLDAVISMPSGVFKPYATVSTAVLVFTKGATTEKIWFYDMEHDGFSLDDKREKVSENDIPDILECWNKRNDLKFMQKRADRLSKLKQQIAPSKKDRLLHHEIIHRLKFEEVVALDAEASKALNAREKAEAELAALQVIISPLEKEINQLGRQLWVSRDKVKDNKYDLSVARYRQIEQDEIYYEKPVITIDRLLKLDSSAVNEINKLRTTLTKKI